MNKKILKNSLITTGISLVSLAIITPSADALANKPGDIIVTKSTAPGLSGKGYTGHAGIYVTSTTILHTSGRKSEPYPRYISEGNWHKRYASSKVVRPTSSTRGKKAAAMAKKYFYGKRIPYAITPGLLNIKKTYCSELVFYSYYKTGSPFIQMDKAAQLISPYAFLNSFAVKYNGFKFVDNKW